MSNLLCNSQLYIYFEFKELVHTSILRLDVKDVRFFLTYFLSKFLSIAIKSISFFLNTREERIYSNPISLFWVIPSELEFHIWNTKVIH